MNRKRRWLIVSPIALALPLSSFATPIYRWRMVTSWPKNSPGPGFSAARLAQRLNQLSDGRIEVTVYGANEIVPALEVMDAVGRKTAELGHTAALFWSGKWPISPFFTTVPFGLNPTQHEAWILFGGGQALWDELYKPVGVKPFLAGNTGPGMGGWFKREINELSDLQGLKFRIAGLGGELFRRLGANPVLLPPGEMFSALQNGTIDAAEFVGPWSDFALGLHRVAPFYYGPGFTKPNGAGECLINRELWLSLPPDLQKIIELACQAEYAQGLAEATWQNSGTLAQIVAQNGRLKRWPLSILQAAERVAEGLFEHFNDADELTQRIYQSYQNSKAHFSRNPFA